MLTIDVETVTFKHDGNTYSVNVADIHESNLAAIFVYGLRRRLQDPLNAARKAARDDGIAWDGEAEVNAMLAKLGEENGLATRSAGGAGRPVWWSEVVKIIRPAVKARDEGAYKNADGATINRWIAEAYDGLSEAKRSAVDKTAQKRWEIAERAKKEAEEVAADIDIDL